MPTAIRPPATSRSTSTTTRQLHLRRQPEPYGRRGQGCRSRLLSNEGQVTPLATDADVAGSPHLATGGAGSLFSAGADGFNSVSVTGPAVQAIYKLASGAPAQEAVGYSSVTDASGNVTLTATGVVSGNVAFTLGIGNNGAYIFEQKAALVHPLFNPSDEDDLPLTFNFTVTDKDGDPATGSLTVTVDDDTPVGGAVVANVDEVTTLTNLMLIVDVSGSMGGGSGIGVLTRLQAAQQAMIDLINAYDANGDVVVRIVTFSSGAAEVGSQWMSVSQAIAAIGLLTAGGTTNYDAALAAAQTAFPDAGAITGGQNVSYFLSDGVPNPTAAGIDPGEEAIWTGFVDANNIISFSLGMGTGAIQGPLDPIAFNGVTSVNTNAVVVDDFADLSGVLIGTAAPILVSGNVTGSMGADGGLFSLTNAGPPAGFTYTVTGNTLLVKDATTLATVLTLTMDPVTGAYTVKQNGPIDHPGAGADVLPFVFTVALTDGDFDGATSTITVNIKDGVPTASNVNAGTLDDDSRTGGIAAGPGDFDPTLSTLSGSLGTAYGSDGPGSISFAGLHGTNQVINGITVSFSWNALASTLTANDGEQNVFEVVVNQATGGYTVNLLASLDHHTNALADNVETDATFNLGYTITDGDTDTANGTLTFTIDDDTPVSFNPHSTALLNNGNAVQTALLDLDGNIDNNTGADGFGSLKFVNISQGQNSGLTSNASPILLFLNTDGTVVEGRIGSATGTKIFTVILTHNPGGNDTYTVDLDGLIDNGAGVVFNDLSGVQAGNPAFQIVESTSSDSLELLLTPGDLISNVDGTSGSINSDSDDVGVGGGQSISPGDPLLRIDYGSFSINTAPNPDQFVIDGHNTVNGARFRIDQIVPGTAGTEVDVRLTTYDADDDEIISGDAGDPIDPITKIQIYASNGTTLLDEATGTGDGSTAGGTFFTFNGDGSVSVANLLEDMFVVTFTTNGFNRLEIDNVTVDNNKFSVSALSVQTANVGSAIDINFDVALTDGDGDLALPTSEINISILPTTNSQIGTASGQTLTGTTAGDFLAGLAGADTLLGQGNSDLLIGGADQDTLTGSTGTDTFYFGATSDSPTLALADLITDFDGDPSGGQDVIDLSAMDANALTSTIEDAFGFVAGATSAVVQNSITWEVSGGQVLVRGDVNGDTTADFVIRLTSNASIASLQAADFVL